ncbi:MAG: AAA family ATPase [Candidatus Micrarchaeia archaeon]
MLYLDSLVIDKFKSFNHSELKFNGGFNCVVGPNGSGKSTICDALLFGLGESAARRLRVDRYDQLIRGITENEKKLKLAHVTLNFKGDENLTISRFIRSDGKTTYKLNGKHMKKHEILSVLMKHGIKADETNTISQGEITTLGNMKPTELRELIDLASGVKEFESKKNEAIKELEKVDQKISESNVVLHTQKGFVDELKADKELAEKYLEITSRLKVLNYSMLLIKKENAEKYLNEFSSTIKALDVKYVTISKKLDDLNALIDSSTKQRQELTRQLSQSNIEMGSINSKLEATNIQIVKLESEIEASNNAIKELELNIKSLTEEKASCNFTIESNNSSIAAIVKKLQPMEERLSKIKLKPEELKSNPKITENLQQKNLELEKRLEELSNEINLLNNQISSDKATLESKKAESISYTQTYNLKKKELAELESKLKNISNNLSNSLANTKKLEQELSKLEQESYALDEKLINLREQRASIRQRSSSNYDQIKNNFSNSKSFFGRVSDLFNYDLKYINAIESTAGSRMDYIIVEDIETANNIIKYMRSNSLGRASFIPLNEIRVNESNDKEKGMTPLMSLITFDKKFLKAMTYIFGNTYLIESIEDSKKFGVGKRRYVTIDGDIVEQSGVVSGGSSGKKISISSIENQIKSFNDKKQEFKNKIDDISIALKNSRKSEAFAEMEAKSLKSSVENIKTEIEKQLELINGIQSEVSSIEKNLSLNNLRCSKLLKDKESIFQEFNENKERLNIAFNEAMEISKRIAESGLNDEEIAKIEALRKESEKLKMDMVSLQKENELVKKRITTIDKEIATKSKSIDTLMQNIDTSKNKKEKQISERKDIEKKISSGSDESKKIYSMLNQLDEKISKYSNEKGHISAEKSSIERQLSESKIKRSQYETSFADISAELSSYKEEITPITGNIPDMEKESIVLSSKIKDMGNVNLRAPEMYAERAKDLENAAEKLETLKTERQAVMRMIEEIDSKKLQTFMGTLNDVLLNFNKLCSYEFKDKPEITLSNPSDPFKGGLVITVTENKIKKILTSMSGGEKSFILLILIIAIHMCKPSSLYIFDEVDASLDKENSKKLSHLIKQMSSNAQFIVVSHNDSLVSSADVAIGVAKSNNESKAVGLEINKILNKIQQ